MEGHQGDQRLVVDELVLLVDQRDLLEELLERRDLALALELPVGVELARHADQLLQVLDPALGLDRPLGLERLDVAGLREHRLEQLGDGPRSLRPLGEARDHLAEAADRLDRGGAEAGDPLDRADASSGVTPVVFAQASSRPSRCCRSRAAAS